MRKPDEASASDAGSGAAPATGGVRLLAVGFAVNLLSGAFLNSFGVLLAPLKQSFGVSQTAIVSAPMLYLAIMSLGSPFVGVLLDRLSIRRVMLTAVGLNAIGLAALSLSTSLWQYLLAAGLLLALPAHAAGLTAGMKLGAMAFPERRGLSIGVVGLGVSLSLMAFPPTTALLLEAFGWREIYGLMAVALLAVLWPMIWFWAPRQKPQSEPVSPIGVLAAMKRFAAAPAFWSVVLVVGAQTAAMGVMSVNLVEIARAEGVDRRQAAACLSLLGGMAAAGKIAWGMAMDRFPGRGVTWTALAFQGVALAMLSQAHTAPVIALACATFGFGLGAVMPMQSLMIGRVLGWGDFAAAYGASVLATLPLGLIALFATARVRDLTGGYEAALIGLVVLMVGAMLVNLGLKPKGRA